MNPSQNRKAVASPGPHDGFLPAFDFPRGAAGLNWSSNAGGEPVSQHSFVHAASAPLSAPPLPYGFDFMAMQAMMAQMTLNPSQMDASAAGLMQGAAFAQQPWISQQIAMTPLGQSPYVQGSINPNNACSNLRNILMNYARRNTPSGEGKTKGSMKRVPTSDAAFFAVGWALDGNPEVTLELAKDPVGSRYVQFRYINPSSAKEQDLIARTLLADFKACAKHACGNYTVQCLLTENQHGHSAQALLCVLGDIDTYATNVYGHRVVQRALDVAEEAVWNKLAQAIVHDIAAYTTHQCAHNVVQKLLTICAEKRVIPPQVLEFLAANASSLASHPYGCRVLQKTLEVMPQSWLSKAIFPALLPLSLTLATNPYGNFVLQKMIPAEAEQIFAHFRQSVVQTSQHKYASNVLEKLVAEAPQVSAATIVSEVIGHPIPEAHTLDGAEKSQANYVNVSGYWLAHPTVARAGPVRQLLIDRYANYVLQKTLQAAPIRSRVVLADAVRVNADQIEGLPYGRQMLQDAVNVLISVGIMVPVQGSGEFQGQAQAARGQAPEADVRPQPVGAKAVHPVAAAQTIGNGFGGQPSPDAPQPSLSFQSGSSWMSPWDDAAHGSTLQPLGTTSSISDFSHGAQSATRGLQSLASAASDPAASSAHEAGAAHHHA